MRKRSAGWTIVLSAAVSVLLTALVMPHGPGGTFDIRALLAPPAFLTIFALLWLPVTLVQLVLIERAGSGVFRSVSVWVAIVLFVPAAWLVTTGVSKQRRDNRAAAQRVVERQSIHERVAAANDIRVISEPLSGPAEDEVISFIGNHDMSSPAQIAAAAHFGHSPRLLYALAMRRDVPAEALSVMYDSSLTFRAAHDTSLTRRSCLRSVDIDDLCILWDRLAWAASPGLLQKMLDGPNPVIRGAARQRRARDDSIAAAGATPM